ncbi:MAG: cation diffusion facilitator family transporter [Acidobacteria bacterium]|jgi:cation diffusion facilitator family transporter|nr:cation diffusion facilitator family transporter [Acidobacteriota bacterium]
MSIISSESRSFLKRYAWLSIAAAVATIGLKLAAWLFTGSVGLLSDALESLVNLAGGIIALLMLEVASRPADKDHAFGHSKAEYFSSGIEGTLILFAAIAITYAAVQRLMHPRPLEQLGIGLAISLVASLVNFIVALVILRAGIKNDSITLRANAHHLMTDVWTSAGVIVGVILVALTGWQWLDPVVAILVAGIIIRTGVSIVRASVLGLMDVSLPPLELQKIDQVLGQHKPNGVQFHALLTRQSGAARFISMHVLVPGGWTVQQGHDLLEQIEAEIRSALTNATVITHLEAQEDPAAWDG